MTIIAQVLRRAREAVTVQAILGTTVIVFGVLGLFLEFLGIVVGSHQSALNGVEEEFWSTHRIIRRVAMIMIPLGVIYVGLLLVESKKISVLYLRKFRLNLNVIDPRHGGGLGRSVRLITLDDQSFKSTGVPAIDVWLSRITPATLLATALLISAVYAGRGPVSEMSEAPRFALVRAMSFEITIALFVLIAFALHQYVAVQRSKVSVESADELPVALSIAQSASSWWNRPALFGRQATIVSAGDKVWQLAVQALSHSVSAVLIDVSDRSAHVKWELSYLTAERIPHVLIMEKVLPIDQSLSSVALEYNIASARELAQFRSAVNEALNRIARTPSKSWRLTKEQRRPILLKLGFTYLMIAVLAAIAAVAFSELSHRLLMSLLYSG